ncbi:MAG: hypothetical protein JWM25_521 [Thermoleophilia bacterium]|nr:hypothetical protein [Thermoleophilia bacterium]
MIRNGKSRAISLLLVLGIAALGAQVAGVGASRPGSRPPVPKRLASLPGASIPDVGSTTLGSTLIQAAEGETIQLKAKAMVAAATLPRAAGAAVVCGIRYSRAGDAAWTLGTPYENLVLAKRGARDTVSIDRSFTAPAKDTYRASMACHVSSPASAKVTATGSITTVRGLPAGAATPIT